MPKVDKKKPLAERLTKPVGQGPQPPPIVTANQLVDIKAQCQWLLNRGFTLRQIRAGVDYLVERQQYDNAETKGGGP